ncbi:MAG: phenylacetate--CoA ligase family protein, partial [Rhizobiaceae bacterium]
MAEFFDRLETRDLAEREADQFARLPAFLRQAFAVAPGLRRWLDEVDPDVVTSRAALARLPVLRKAEL